MSLQQAQLEGLCLRFPENLGLHPALTYEYAVNMLLRAIPLSNQLPYQWGYIDKPLGSKSYLRIGVLTIVKRGPGLLTVFASADGLSERWH
jgi:hypothetical protein